MGANRQKTADGYNVPMLRAWIEKRICLLTLILQLLVLALVGISCATAPSAEVPWLSSSLDFNTGRAHRLILKNTEPQSAVKRIATLAEKRDVIIVFSSCKDDVCEFSMKRKPQTATSVEAGGYSGKKWVSLSVSATNATFSSQFFGRASATDAGTVLEMLGAPVMNETVGCPPALEKLHRCKLTAVGVKNSESVPEVVSAQFGVDVTGHVEAEIISGIYTELKLQ